MAEDSKLQFIFFKISGQSFALPLDNVERVLPMLEISFLENVSPKILGIINVKEELIPIVDFAGIFKISDFNVSLESRIIVVKTSKYKAGFIVDEVEGYRELPENYVTGSQELWPGLENIKGVVRLEEGGAAVIRDVEEMLSLKEVEKFNKAISNFAKNA